MDLKRILNFPFPYLVKWRLYFKLKLSVVFRIMTWRRFHTALTDIILHEILLIIVEKKIKIPPIFFYLCWFYSFWLVIGLISLNFSYSVPELLSVIIWMEWIIFDETRRKRTKKIQLRMFIENKSHVFFNKKSIIKIMKKKN